MFPVALALLLGCGSRAGGAGGGGTAGTTQPSGSDGVADVVEVAVSGDEGAYTFAVTVRSDETGCDQYADWWEVVSASGDLVYRRILNHSHPDEQPFTRTGGPVPASATDELVVRAHHVPGGYAGDVARGTVAAGFSVIGPDPEFHPELAQREPLPADCWF